MTALQLSVLLLVKKNHKISQPLEENDLLIQGEKDKTEQEIMDSLGELKINWESGTNPDKKGLELLEIPPIVYCKAGENMDLELNLKNTSQKSYYKIWGKIKNIEKNRGKTQLIEENEIYWGKISPGEIKRTVYLKKIPIQAVAQTIKLELEIFDENDNILLTYPFSIAVREKDITKISFKYQISEDKNIFEKELDALGILSNKSGTIEPGEKIQLKFLIKNVSDISSEKNQISIRFYEKDFKNKGGIFPLMVKDISLRKGFEKELQFSISIPIVAEEGGLFLEFSFRDIENGYQFYNLIKIPIGKNIDNTKFSSDIKEAKLSFKTFFPLQKTLEKLFF